VNISKLKLFFSLTGVFCLFFAFLFLCSSASLLKAAEYVAIEIHPKHVGVFTTDGKQQFVAFGVTASGSRVNITKKVSWKSSDSNLVAINDNGVATIKPGVTAGQVKISCSYPKGSSMTAVIGSLLRPSYTVNATVTGSEGLISPEGDSMVKRGNHLILDLSPDDGFEVVASLVSGTCPQGAIINDYTQYQTGAITEDCTVIIPFSEMPRVTPSKDPTHNQGSITPDGSTPVYVHTDNTQLFAISPNTGFEVDTSLTINDEATDCPGVTFSGNHNNTMEVGPITASCEVRVHFSSLPKYNISASTAGDGTITPASPPLLEVQKWQTQQFTLDPDDGFTISHIDGTCPQGTLIPATGDTYTYTTGEIIAACTVEAHFSDNTVTLNSSVTNGPGTVTPEGDTTYVIGNTASFTLNPTTDGYIASLVSDSCSAGGDFTDATNTKYVTAALDGNCAVAFEFVLKTYTLTVSSTGDGGIHTGNLLDGSSNDIFCYQSNPADDLDGCTHVYTHGDTVVLHAQENFLNPDASFISWTNCPAANGQDCTVTMTGDTAVSASFAE